MHRVGIYIHQMHSGLPFVNANRFKVARLTSPFCTKVLGYIGDKVLLEIQLRQVKDDQRIVTYRPRCLFVQRRPTMGKDRKGSFEVITLAPTTGWKLTIHHKIYLSVQCDTLCNCGSSVPIIFQYLTTLIL